MKNKKISMIKQSLDYKKYLSNILLLLLLIFFTIVACFFLKDYQIVNYIFIIVLVCLVIYNMINVIYLFKNINNYEFIETEFKDFHFLIRRAYFVVKLNINNNNIEKETRCIFNSIFYSGLNVENYVGKKVLIGYNQYKNKILTIKIIK